MPSNVNGFGTKYYGQRDFRLDGSYVTTNFFCLGFFPVIPLHSVRVIPDPKNSWMPFSKNYYAILEKRWPNPLQVLSIYLWSAAAAGMASCSFGKSNLSQGPWPVAGARLGGSPPVRRLRCSADCRGCAAANSLAETRTVAKRRKLLASLVWFRDQIKRPEQLGLLTPFALRIKHEMRDACPDAPRLRRTLFCSDS